MNTLTGDFWSIKIKRNDQGQWSKANSLSVAQSWPLGNQIADKIIWKISSVINISGFNSVLYKRSSNYDQSSLTLSPAFHCIPILSNVFNTFHILRIVNLKLPSINKGRQVRIEINKVTLVLSCNTGCILD